MQALRDNLPAIGIGAAALAIAGYIVYQTDKAESKRKRSKSESNRVEEQFEEEEPVDLDPLTPEFNFLSASLSSQERERLIVEWVEKMIAKLLKYGHIQVKNLEFEAADFIWLLHIIENRKQVFLFDEKKTKQAQRLEIIKQHGFESTQYLEALYADLKDLERAWKGDDLEILGKIGFDQAITAQKSFDISKDKFIGSEEDFGEPEQKDLDFIRNSFEFLFYYPFEKQAETSATEERIVGVWDKVLKRFQQPDVFEAGWQCITDYIHAFDLACTDVARSDLNMSEPDYREWIQKFDADKFFSSKRLQSIFSEIRQTIKSLLALGEEEQEPVDRQKTHNWSVQLPQNSADNAKAEPVTTTVKTFDIGESFPDPTQAVEIKEPVSGFPLGESFTPEQEAAKEAERVKELERLTAEKAEEDRILAEKAEQDRIAAEKAEQDRIAAEKAEQYRIAAEKAEQERIAALKAEQERIAAEKAEQERIAAEKAEQERIAAEKAEKERVAAEKAEQERIAAEKAEQARLAEEQRIREEKEAAEKAAAEKAAAEEALLQQKALEEQAAKVKANAELDETRDTETSELKRQATMPETAEEGKHNQVPGSDQQQSSKKKNKKGRK